MAATFGQLIRATRLGFHELDGRCFVRVSDAAPTRHGWLVEITPIGLVPTTRRPESYRRWWDSPETVSAIRRLPAIQRYDRRQGRVTILVDDNGREATW